MLFAVKRHALACLLVLLMMVGLAYGVGGYYAWNWEWKTHAFLVCVLVLASSDGLLHGIGCLGWGENYSRRYRDLVHFFDGQGALPILAGGLLAGVGEELLFRGIILQGLRGPCGDVAAVALSAILFGLAHWLWWRPLLHPFVIWATWEGALLGMAYLYSDSLFVNMVLHGSHDVLGFTLFALQRRTGWLLGEVTSR